VAASRKNKKLWIIVGTLGALVVLVVGIAVVLSATILVQRPDRKAPAEPRIAVEPIE